MKKFSVRLLLFIVLVTASAHVIAQFQYVCPVPGSTYNTLERTIILRQGDLIDASSLNQKNLFVITGDKSGAHAFATILADDGKTIILTPATPFAEGETIQVAVKRGIKTVSGKTIEGFLFQFKTIPHYTYEQEQENAAAEKQYEREEWPSPDSSSGGSESLSFINISTNTTPAPGDIFFNNSNFLQNNTGHYSIMTNNGDSVYDRKTDFAGFGWTINHNGYLTCANSQGGSSFEMFDSNYVHLASWKAKNGYYLDNHECQVYPDGHCFIICHEVLNVDMTVYDSTYSTHASVIENVVQEQDAHHHVIFEWRTFDHIAIPEAIHECLACGVIDAVHMNAIDQDPDGNIIVSCRHLDQIDKIDISTGNFIWRLGGVENEYTFTNDPAQFNYQHCVRRLANGDITLFDNGNWYVPPTSYAKEYQLDEVNKLATLVWSYQHPQVNGMNVVGLAMGSVQRLADNHTLIDWGLIATNGFPNMTEVDENNQIVWEAELNFANSDYSYRTWKYDWSPCSRPSDSRLSTHNITNNSAVLNWNWGTNANKFAVQYQVAGTTTWTNTVVSGTSLHLHGLAPSTTYAWRVKSKCSNGNSGSTAIKTFQTLPLRMIETGADDGVVLYPNPSSGELNLLLGEKTPADVQITMTNITGEIFYLAEWKDGSAPDHLIIPLTNTPPGVYLVNIMQGSSVIVKKVVVE